MTDIDLSGTGWESDFHKLRTPGVCQTLDTAFKGLSSTEAASRLQQPFKAALAAEADDPA